MTKVSFNVYVEWLLNFISTFSLNETEKNFELRSNETMKQKRRRNNYQLQQMQKKDNQELLSM